MTKPNETDRCKGALVGLACGDALGTTLEFIKPNSITKPLTGIVGGGPFNLKAGEWTDDTSMALCLAESLITQQGFNAEDQMSRYCRWMDEGYLSSTGKCFDIGNTVSKALNYFLQTNDEYAGAAVNTAESTSGNGSIMRLAAIPMMYSNDPEKAIAKAAQSSKTTHGSELAIDGCKLLSGLIVAALSGIEKRELLSPYFKSIESERWNEKQIHPLIYQLSGGVYKTKNPPEIKGTGYVIESLEAALWAFYHSNNFKEGCLLAANLGDDADTTAAVYGQLAGAFYGINGIPEDWRKLITELELIEQMAIKLMNTDYID